MREFLKILPVGFPIYIEQTIIMHPTNEAENIVFATQVKDDKGVI